MTGIDDNERLSKLDKYNNKNLVFINVNAEEVFNNDLKGYQNPGEVDKVLEVLDYVLDFHKDVGIITP